MEQKTPDEFDYFKFHDFHLAVIRMVFVPEPDIVLIEFHNSGLGNPDAMRVVPQVLYDTLCRRERLLRVDHPALRSCLFNNFEYLGFVQSTRTLKLLMLHKLVETFQKQAPEE